MDLNEIRQDIDVIDDEIVRLFEKRMKLSSEVADFKIKTGKPVFDQEREISKLAALKAKAQSEFTAAGVQELFQQIMSMSRKLQYRLLTEHGIEEAIDYEFVEELPIAGKKVVYQGVEGAYTYEAMHRFFGENVQNEHVHTWREVMESIARGDAQYAILPIENSTAGIVTDVYDLLGEFDLYIVGEQVIKCEHALLGVRGASLSDIEDVYSHPQALSQCKKYLETHPQWTQHEYENTASAARKIARDHRRTQAAIASEAAAKIFDLDVLQKGIYYNEDNYTRFIIVSKKQRYVSTANKISICFEIPHESGTLYNMLSHFIYNGLNMSKIESRPIPGKSWEYRFFVDFTGNLRDSSVKNALRGIRQEAKYVRVFGNY